ncbi:hypothetical protein VU04_12190, partial [Desulfobulbus sp. TB]|nr:hypothetical protein [Desulfobulbus sp. TB]
FRDAADGWVNTRGIWNQHAYTVTNINDDGTIPAFPATNWLEPDLNTFRSNSQGTGTVSPFAAPDLIVTELTGECVPDTYDVRVTAHVHNQGEASASAGVQVAFYLGDPELGGTLWGVKTIPTVLPDLGSTPVVFETLAPGGSEEVFAVVDNDGTGVGSETECREENNVNSALIELNCTPNTPPVAQCKDITLNISSIGQAVLSPSQVDNSSSDPDGDPITYSLSKTNFSCSDIGTQHAVTLTVTDDSGESDSCVAKVTVVDNTAPNVKTKGVTVQLNANGNASISAADINNGSSDNCGIASISVSPTSFTCANVGANTVTLTVTDNNGNVGTATATVTVEDNIAPVVLTQDVIAHLVDDTCNAS